jgi:hypothetical protein
MSILDGAGVTWFCGNVSEGRFLELVGPQSTRGLLLNQRVFDEPWELESDGQPIVPLCDCVDRCKVKEAGIKAEYDQALLAVEVKSNE